MAKKEISKENSKFEIPPDTPVEVFGFKDDKTIKTVMSYEKFLGLVAENGWLLRAYQTGHNTTIVKNK